MLRVGLSAPRGDVFIGTVPLIARCMRLPLMIALSITDDRLLYCIALSMTNPAT